jgi:hypothetical protein
MREVTSIVDEIDESESEDEGARRFSHEFAEV